MEDSGLGDKKGKAVKISIGGYYPETDEADWEFYLSRGFIEVENR
jgi:hypothetical protein